MTIEQPAARAGMTFHMPIISGNSTGRCPPPPRPALGPRTVTRPCGNGIETSSVRPLILVVSPRCSASSSGCSRPQGAGDGGFLLEGFQLRQLFAVLLHQIGKTQQDAFTVSRCARPSGDRQSAPRTSPPGRHPPGWRRRWWHRLPGGRIPTVNRFRSARRRGAVDTGHADGLKLLDAGKQRYL